MKVSWRKHRLLFKFKAGTSRGVLKKKDSYFIIVQGNKGLTGIGECSLIEGLSIDDPHLIERKLNEICHKILETSVTCIEDLDIFFNESSMILWPAIRMGIETAFLDLLKGGKRIIFNNEFLNGDTIPINGLIWMGTKDFMLEQIRNKIKSGYTTIKIKIGTIDFETELGILAYIRKEFDKNDITLRVDANGAFSEAEVRDRLDKLSKFDLHSIEQPIRKGDWELMAKLCQSSPIPIALDEELIGSFTLEEKKLLMDSIKPQFLVLKPSLLGGFSSTQEWIKIAKKRNMGWWITSALESNIGLNAICQYTFDNHPLIEQGLGTGQLFTNNIESPLAVAKGLIYYDQQKKWDLSFLNVDCI